MIWAHDSHFCNQEIVEYIAFHTKHQTPDATVLGISLDCDAGKKDAQESAEMVRRHAPTLTACGKDWIPLDVDVSPFDTGKKPEKW